MNYRKSIGIAGEKVAETFLRKKGLKYLERNFIAKRCEIDLIFEDTKNNIIVFIEVKTKKNNKYSDPEESVHYKKQQNIKKAASEFLKMFPKYSNFDIRFDVISVLWEDNSIFHFENAF